MTDTNLGNNVATDTDTLVLFGSPYPPAPAATSANMLLRRGDGLYAIYNLGNNATHPSVGASGDRVAVRRLGPLPSWRYGRHAFA